MDIPKKSSSQATLVDLSFDHESALAMILLSLDIVKQATVAREG